MPFTPGLPRKRISTFLAAGVLAAISPPPLPAAVLTWDLWKIPSSPKENSGSWDTSNTYWSTLGDPSGQSPNSPTDVRWLVNSTNTAIFGNGGGTTTGSSTTNYTITIISGGVSVGAIVFAPLAVASDGIHGSDYQLSGGPIKLNLPETSITVNNTNSPNLITIPDAEISSQITGNSNLTIIGPGTLEIGNVSASAPNNYVGTTTIAAAVYLGSISTSNARSATAVTNAFGAPGNTVVLSNGTITNNLSGGNPLSLAYSFNLPANTTSTIYGTKNSATNLGSATFPGATTGSGALTFNLGNNSNSNANSLYSDYSNFTGTLLLNGGGILRAYSTGGAFNGGAGMALDVESTDTTPTILNPQTDGDGDTFSFGSLTSATASATIAGGVIGPGNNGTATYIIGSLNRSTTYDGMIGTSANPNAALTKVGTGSLTLTNLNLYIGATTISNGTLVVNGAITASTATVGANGTLAGIGSISLAAVDNGTLDPGATDANSIGNLSFGSDLALGATAIYAADYNAEASDVLAVAGNLSLANGDKLVLSSLDGTTSGTFVIATYGGNLIGKFTSVPANVTVNYGTGTNSAITVTVTPEPTSLGMLSMGAAMLFARRRRAR